MWSRGWAWLLLCTLVAVASIASSDSDFTDDIVWEVEHPELDRELTEQEYQDIANIIKTQLTETDDEARSVGSVFKIISRGLMKGVKAIGKGGKKLIKITGKGLMKGGKKLGKATFKLAKGVGKGLIKVTVAGAKGTIKFGKSAGKAVTKGGKKVWTAVKNKFKGKLGKASKKLLKYVAKKGLKKGSELAIQAITPLIMEYFANKTFESMCSCADQDNNHRCICCVKPPGFESTCLAMRARPRVRAFTAAITYNRTESLVSVSVNQSMQSEKTCKFLPMPLDAFRTCITALGAQVLEGKENSFRGCVAIAFEPTPLEREMCMEFSGNVKVGTSRWLHPNEIDTVGEDE